MQKELINFKNSQKIRKLLKEGYEIELFMVHLKYRLNVKNKFGDYIFSELSKNEGTKQTASVNNLFTKFFKTIL
ncbi:MAG: hypothetical protein WC358_00120 [Ignavibacteria bacterium]|jgi:hypothetical protein